MSKLKPGEFRITDQAMKIWNLKRNDAVLDVGCGQGETVEYLGKEYGYKATGIDISKELIAQGLARRPKLNIKFGDGEFLDGFSSYTFNGVMMECVLSLINLPDEALHEAYCVLKKGGKLFISDLYIKNPTPEFLAELQEAAEKEMNTPHFDDKHENAPAADTCDDCTDCGECHEHSDEECGNDEGHDHDDDDDDHGLYCSDNRAERTVNFRSSGRFLITPLIALLQEIGYTNIAWGDCSKELDNYVAETIMRDGTLSGCFCKDGINPKDEYKTGYFMLTADKPL